MKTATVNNEVKAINYRTSTDMYTRLTNSSIGKSGQYGADAYNVDEDEDSIVIVATTATGRTLTATATVITIDEWAALIDKHDVYNGMEFHLAVMSRLGFE